MRYQITSDTVVDLPVGKGKHFAGNAPNWLDEVVGGLQVSSIYTFHTGNPRAAQPPGSLGRRWVAGPLAPGLGLLRYLKAV